MYDDFVQDQNDYLSEFLGHSDRYIFLLLDQEGNHLNPYCSCGALATARCMDCLPLETWCKRCCRNSHRLLPFHRIKIWNGRHFESSSLNQIGYVLYLGHSGAPCPHLLPRTPTSPLVSSTSSDSAPTNFDQHTPVDTPNIGTDQDVCSSSAESLTVVHSNGVHLHRALYCTCVDAPPRDEQLMSVRMLPSSWQTIRTAFTFDCLNGYLLESVECKITLSSFWGKLVRYTNNCFPHKVPVSLIKFTSTMLKLDAIQFTGPRA